MISAIILAAGTSSRMQGKNKLLLPWNDSTVIRTTANQVAECGAVEIVVVTGFESDKIAAALTGLGITIVHNPAYRSGMTGSIQSGVYRCTGDAYMICLGDMVVVKTEEYSRLVQRAEELIAEGAPFIVLPRYGKQKANPVIFSAHFRNELLAYPEPEGCRGLVEANRDCIEWVEMNEPNVMKDIDYREDYQKLLDEQQGS